MIPSTPSSRSFLAAAVACAALVTSGAGNAMNPRMPRSLAEGTAFGATSASPVDRILGPATSPDSMRSRMIRVFFHAEPVSNTLVNPKRVNAA